MTVREFRLPDPGEGLTEADIVTWRVAVGDVVAVNDIVVEIETAKSLVELPIPYAGTITALLVDEGTTVEVGTPIIAVDDGVEDGSSPGAASGVTVAGGGADAGDVADGVAASLQAGPAGAATERDDGAPPREEALAQAATGDTPAGASGSTGSSGDAAGEPKRTPVLVGYGVKVTEAKRRPRRKEQLKQTIAHRPDEEEHVDTQGISAGPGELVAEHSMHVLRDRRPLAELAYPSPEAEAKIRVLAKPPVRKLAADLGVDLARVRGSGEGGIVTRADVESAAIGSVAVQASPAAGVPGAGSEPGAPGGGAASGRGEQRIPIKGVRKVTAAAMVGSAFTAPHVSEWVSVDVTATMELVERLKRDKEFSGVKVSPLLVLAKAICVAIRRNPGINATWDEQAQEIVQKGYVNLGIAAATPRGLLVPNIKDADLLTMRELGAAITALAETARAGKTQPAEMSGGTITITNIGVFGIDAGTPIINPGESAIVAFGTIARRPWVVGTGEQERIEPRWVTTLAVSFDHRLVDGELGSRFLADVAAILADPARGLVWG